MCIHCQNFISIEAAVQEFGGGFTQPPFCQGVGKKHLGRARVNFDHEKSWKDAYENMWEPCLHKDVLINGILHLPEYFNITTLYIMHVQNP